MKKEVQYFFEYVYPNVHSMRDNYSKKLVIFKKKGKIRFVISYLIYYLFELLSYPVKFFENLFFLKNEYFKSNTKGKNLFTKAIWTTFVILTLSILFKLKPIKLTHNGVNAFCGIEIKDMAFFAVLFLGLYWNARSVFTKKWDYSAALFNKLCFDLPFRNYPNRESKLITINYTQTTLSLDLLTLEIWSHKSFYYTFLESIHNAIAYSVFLEDFKKNGGKKINLNYIESCIKAEYEKLFSKDITNHEEVRKYLNTFNSDLSDYVVNNNYL